MSCLAWLVLDQSWDEILRSYTARSTQLSTTPSTLSSYFFNLTHPSPSKNEFARTNTSGGGFLASTVSRNLRYSSSTLDGSSYGGCHDERGASGAQ